MEHEKLVDTKEMAEILGVTPLTVDNWRGKGMPFFKRDRAVRFSVEEVKAWYRNKDVSPL